MTIDQRPTHLLRFMNAEWFTEPETVAWMRRILFPDHVGDDDAPLVDIADDLAAVWGPARLGLIVRCRDLTDLDLIRHDIPDAFVYDVVHRFWPIRPLDVELAEIDWLRQPSSIVNGYHLYAFRKDSPKHKRRVARAPASHD